MRTMVVAVVLALAVPSPATSQSIQETQIQLRLDHPIRVRGSVRGSEMVRYRFNAPAEARLSIGMESNNPRAHFDLNGPLGIDGMPDKPVFASSASATTFTGRIPRSGTYTIRISLDHGMTTEEAYYRLDLRLAGVAGPGQWSENAAAAASPGVSENWRVVGFKAGSGLNIRAAPSAHADVIARATNGEVLKRGSCRTVAPTGWCQVTTQAGVEGWAAERLLGQ